MRQGFEQARASGARGVMIIQQANMFPDYLPYPARPKGAADGFEELRVALQRETQRFSGPVVLAHGDTHYFRVDKPIGMRAGKAVDARPSIENFTRVELFGMPNHHWVQVTVDPNDRQLFSFRQRIVEQNIYKGPR
jgi:hypothetical protein